GDDGGPAAAGRDEVVDELPHRGAGSGEHGRQLDIGHRPVDQDDVEVAFGGLPQQGGGLDGGDNDEPVDLPLEEVAYVVVLLVEALVGVPHDDRVARRPGGVLHRAGELGEE